MIGNIKIILTSFVVVLSLLSSAFVSQVAMAQPAGGNSCNKGGILDFPRWYDNGICKNGKIVSPNEFPSKMSGFIWAIVLNIIDMMLYVVGYVSLAFIIWGGFKYIISGDNSGGTVSARKTILNAVIGLVLSIMSIGIVNVVAGAIK